ncbi:MAG: GldG family protein [Candidatus Sedimenticola sp. (ex Thyasira tokunagai)]
MAIETQKVKQKLEGLTFYLLLAVAVGLTGWLSQRHDPVWDWTAGARNSLSPVSQQLLTRLQGELKVTSFAPDNPELRRRIREIIQRYQRHHPKIRLTFVNPALEPKLTRELGIQVAGELHLAYQGRSENLRSLDEESISNAIQRLIIGGEQWLAAIEGHGERRFSGRANHDLGAFGDELRRKGYQIQALDLATQPQIPGNSQLLVIAGPQTDYLPGELSLIRKHIEEGGNLLWLTDPGEQHGVDGLLNETGLKVLPGTIVDANTTDLGLESPTIALVSRFPDHPATANFRLLTLYPAAAALKVEGESSWQATPLLSTLPRSWNETGPISGEVVRNPNQGERAGPLTLGYAFTRSGEKREQRLLVIGDGDFLSNAYLGNGGNLDLGLNLLRWLSGNDRLLDIPAKSAADLSLTLTPTIGGIIGLGFLFLLPLLFISTGVVIRWRRRRE